MANVNGHIKLWRKEVEKDSETYVFYSTTVGSKDKEGKYINAYLAVVFSGKEPKLQDFEQSKDANPCMDIDLKEAFLSTRKRKGKEDKEIIELVLVVQKWAKHEPSKEA